MGIGYRCPVCMSKFGLAKPMTQKALIRHITVAHSHGTDDTTPVPCPICTAKASDPARKLLAVQGSLSEHFRRVHQTRGRQVCAGIFLRCGCRLS